MDKNLINSHDRFFKELFSKREEVKEFISKTLPDEITRKLNFDTLEIDTTEYINRRLRTNFSDIVYNCVYGESTQIKISLLFEHKSYPETYPHFQILEYMLGIWQKQLDQGEQLTPIIPILFYHGQKLWNKRPFEKYFESIDETLQKFVPRFDYHLIDLSAFSDQQIKDLFKSIELQIGLLLLKNIYNEQKILQKLKEIFAGIQEILQNEQGEQFFESIVAYLFYSTNLETTKIVEKMREISPKAGEKFISTAMRLKMQGKLEGIEAGIKKVAFTMLKKGYTDQEIIEVTGLTAEQLELLKSLDEYRIDLDDVL